MAKVSASNSDEAILSGLFGGLGGNLGANGGLSGFFMGSGPSSSALASSSSFSTAAAAKPGPTKNSTAAASMASVKTVSRAAEFGAGAAAPLAASTGAPDNAGKAGPSAPLGTPAPLSVGKKPGQLSRDEHKQVLELFQVWERRICDQAAAFGTFAKEALAFDDELAEGALHIQELHAGQVRLKAKADVADRSLQLIFDQQDALGRLMTGLTDSLGLQEQLANRGAEAVGGGSNAAKRRAEGLEHQLEELHAQVRKLSEETLSFQTLHYSQPMERVAAVLGAHSHELDALQQRLYSAERRFAAVETRSRMADVATSMADGN